MTINIAIADDHPIVIKGLRNTLADYPYIALKGTYPNGTRLLEGLEKEQPDILLLDIQLPGKTGDELVPIILKKYPDLKILVLTNFDSPLYVNSMLRLGVHGYLLKTTEEELLIEAIEAVYNGKQFIEPEMDKKMQQLAVRVKKSVSSRFTLTDREKEVLQFIANGDTNAEIAEKLFLSYHTIENYRISLLLKLDVKNTAMLIKKALLMGLVK